MYVRPAGSYVMDRLELRRVALYPGDAESEAIVILVGHFNIPAGLRAAEATLSNLQVRFYYLEHTVCFCFCSTVPHYSFWVG